MTSTQPVWISPHAYERLQRELATLRELCTATAAAVTATETVPLSNACRHGFNKFMTYWSMRWSAKTHPTTGSPNPTWF